MYKIAQTDISPRLVYVIYPIVLSHAWRSHFLLMVNDPPVYMYSQAQHLKCKSFQVIEKKAVMLKKSLSKQAIILKGYHVGQ